MSQPDFSSTALPGNGQPNPSGTHEITVKDVTPSPSQDVHPGDMVVAAVTLDTLVERVNLIKEAMKRCMVEGQHFGTIPGTKKPSLWKPGAELICTLFQLGTRYPNHANQVTRENGHFTFTLTCELFHIPTGRVIGEGVGAASTMEHRYRIQTEERTYPNGNTVPAKYTPYDFYNTALKIARKRSLVDAVMTVTGASEIFTQDLEDLPEELRKDTLDRTGGWSTRQAGRQPLPQRPKPPAPNGDTNGNGQADPQAPAADWTPGKSQTLKGKVDRAYPQEYQGQRYWFAKVNGCQLQTQDMAQGGELLSAIGQEIQALVEASPKSGKFYLKTVITGNGLAKPKDEEKRSPWEEVQRLMSEADVDETTVLAIAKKLQLIPDRTPKLSALAKPVYQDLLESWPDIVQTIRQAQAATEEAA
jgi:hypothetical protein